MERSFKIDQVHHDPQQLYISKSSLHQTPPSQYPRLESTYLFGSHNFGPPNGHTSCNNFRFGLLALVLNIVPFLVHVRLLQSLHSLFVFITSVMARRPLCFLLSAKAVMMNTNFLFIVVLLARRGWHTYVRFLGRGGSKMELRILRGKMAITGLAFVLVLFGAIISMDWGGGGQTGRWGMEE